MKVGGCEQKCMESIVTDNRNKCTDPSCCSTLSEEAEIAHTCKKIVYFHQWSEGINLAKLITFKNSDEGRDYIDINLNCMYI